MQFTKVPIEYLKGVYESPVTNDKKFITACNRSYANSAFYEEDSTLRAIEQAANNIKEVSDKSYWYGRLAYARIHYEFDNALERCQNRDDGDKECRYFALAHPAEKFKIYRRICGDDWSDDALLDRLYYEAQAEFRHSSETRTSLFIMPKDSWMKAAVLERILLTHKRKFQETYLLYSEALRAWLMDGWVDRDTKIILDKVRADKVFLNTIDHYKYDIVRDYIKDAEVVDWFGDAWKILGRLTTSGVPRLFYINGAFYRTQRPELINWIKKRSPNSLVIMVMLNLYEFSRQRNMEAHRDELSLLGVNPDKYYNFDTIKRAFVKHCKYPVQFYHYDSSGRQEKCLVVA